MRRFILAASFTVLLTPYVASAGDWGDNDRDDRRHRRKMSADQMAGAGLAVAAVLGAAGYLVLRKRNTA